MISDARLDWMLAIMAMHVMVDSKAFLVEEDVNQQVSHVPNLSGGAQVSKIC